MLCAFDEPREMGLRFVNVNRGRCHEAY
jgi:hypothetical protein